ncbi:MAG: hypothetical protein KIT80_01560 [Chitinophagaceae bacterium]|nr:hypothetical protein [Chitinophagaceae bacterium]MCW5925573.1 hypothetical protein [Chitinophagaceae bacterium]
MKNRLNITIDDTLITEVRCYAVRNNTSLSRLTEDYFKKLVTQLSPKKHDRRLGEKSVPRRRYRSQVAKRR